jgi:hypothetical protein
MADFESFNYFLNEAYLLQRRRDSLFDIEEGPTLEQVSDETATPLHTLLHSNLSTFSNPTSLTCEQSSTFTTEAASPLRCSLRRSPRQTTHDVSEGYECECPHVKRVVIMPTKPCSHRVVASPVSSIPHVAPVHLPAPPVCATESRRLHVDNIEALLFVAEAEPLEVIWKDQSRSTRWSPYPTSPSPSYAYEKLSSTGSYAHEGASSLRSNASKTPVRAAMQRAQRLMRHCVRDGYLCECPHMRRVC